VLVHPGRLGRRDLHGVLGLPRLPFALLRGADPEADVMGARAIAAAEPTGMDEHGPEARDRVA
jgi:hypothetical protein